MGLTLGDYVWMLDELIIAVEADGALVTYAHLPAGSPMMDEWVEERADHEAALTLIDVGEYEAAEHIVGSNVYALADELSLSPHIVHIVQDTFRQ